MNDGSLQRLLHKCGSLEQLKKVHALSITLGLLHKHQSLACKLFDTYKNVGKTQDAHRVFDQIQEPDIVSWTCLINLYLQVGLPSKSLSAFSHFLCSGLRPDSFLVLGALSSCGRGDDLISGKAIHGIVCRNQLDVNPIVGNALIDMYCRNGHVEFALLVFEKMRVKDVSSWTSLSNGFIMCNDLHSARQLFDKMPERNAIAWTAMMTGYVRGGAPVHALELFKQMKADMEAHPNAVTMVAVLSGCADIGALDFGQSLHGNVNKSNLKLDVAVNNALMDMYSKSGRLDLAVRIFSEMLNKDVFSWTTMISGYAYHGEGHHALDVYSNVLESGVTPNEVTFLSVLMACAHAGLVVEGNMLFNRMIQCHRLKPKIEHYGCLVDLLDRAGLLEEAKEVISNMPMNPDATIWRSLLTSCLVHGNFSLAQIAGKKIIELEPDDDGVYILLWNMYCSANMWKEALEVRKLMRHRRIKKRPGCSWVEVNGVVQEFLAEDTFVQVSAELCHLLQGIKQHSKTYANCESFPISQDV
ncbi:hypothetical protein L6164_006285 [Bauhinia variegata]|uniref:Uncharacterized protein n=1 Tax=Bauhinia variegata TaxID=167791 RepID=A0ACB9PWL9_BAUVA|nr:hypothetical protein L6164_006285 [Bauhinia variegata]